MATTSKNNLDPQIAAFGVDLDAIRKEAGEAHLKLEGHHAHVRAALVMTYDLGLKLIEQDLLKDFLEAHVKPLTQRYMKNAFHDIVTLGFPNAREDSRSKYRKVLKYAQGEYWDVETFRAKADGGIDDLYLEALKGEAFDPDEKFAESDEEHYDRAKTILSKASLGSVAGLKVTAADVHQVDGFATAILRISNSTAEVVGFLPEEPDEAVKKRIASFAPPETKRTRAKLKDKALYKFFVICDVFNRCLPKPDELIERLTQAKEPPPITIPTGASGAEAAKRIKAKQKAAPITLGDLDAVKNVLWIKKGSQTASLTATIGTLLPAMIMMEAEMPLAEFPIGVPKLEIAYTDARKFYFEFLTEFPFGAQHDTSGTTIHVSSTPQQKFHYAPPASATTSYQSLKTGAVPIASFCLTKGTMAKLSSWRGEFSASATKGPIKSFPKVLEFGLDGTMLGLHFPNSPREMRPLANVVPQGPTFSTPGMHWYLETRYLERMILLAKDYGVDFEVSLLAMANAPFAVEFACVLPTGRCKLTLPLSTGPLTGLIEITQPIPVLTQPIAAAPQPVLAATPSNPATP